MRCPKSRPVVQYLWISNTPSSTWWHFLWIRFEWWLS